MVLMTVHIQVINLFTYSSELLPFYCTMLCRVRLCHSMSSVRLSVTFRYHDHIGWNTLKIISWPNSVRYLLTFTPSWAMWSSRNTPKLGWNKGWSHEHKDLSYISETMPKFSRRAEVPSWLWSLNLSILLHC